MIAACPKCGARYRIDGARVGPGGAKLRCSRCEVVFRVTPPPAVAETVQPAPVEAPNPTPQPSTAPLNPVNLAAEPASALQLAQGSEGAANESQSALVLIADPDPESAKALANTLSNWGLRPILAHDGVEAIMTVQRALPRVVILDAALPKMFGFQICEFMKRNESLRKISVVLIGAIHHRDRYRRPPSELYGADFYVERPDLPDALRGVLEGLGLLAAEERPVQSAGTGSDVQSSTAPGERPVPQFAMPSRSGSLSQPEISSFGEPPTSEFKTPTSPPVVAPPAPMAPPAPEPVASPPILPVAPVVAPPVPIASSTPAAPVSVPVPVPAPVAASPVPVSSETSEELAQAERLARIIVSDIVLYNQAKFDAAVGAGNVLEAMQAEMDEARGLFTQRVDSAVRETRDFLADELIRVARVKGMQ